MCNPLVTGPEVRLQLVPVDVNFSNSLSLQDLVRGTKHIQRRGPQNKNPFIDSRTSAPSTTVIRGARRHRVKETTQTLCFGRERKRGHQQQRHTLYCPESSFVRIRTGSASAGGDAGTAAATAADVVVSVQSAAISDGSGDVIGTAACATSDGVTDGNKPEQTINRDGAPGHRPGSDGRIAPR